jgi:hypothetical protein
MQLSEPHGANTTKWNEETTMNGNSDGFLGSIGHATAVSRAARRLDEDDFPWVRRTPTSEPVAVLASPSRGQQLLSRLADVFLTTGSWLKAQAQPTG